MPFYPHGIKRLGSPGFELEQQFYEWLNNNSQYYDKFRWLSYDKKAVFDFFIKGYDTFFYVDVVGFRYQYRKRRLYTRHKDWSDLIEWAEKDAEGYGYKVKCYLAFEGYNYKDEFSFLRITEDLPSSDIYISPRRAKAIRSADGVFDSVFERKRYKKDWLKLCKMTRKQLERSNKKLKAVDSWIFGDVKA
jgi:hypothetical protein